MKSDVWRCGVTVVVAVMVGLVPLVVEWCVRAWGEWIQEWTDESRREQRDVY